MCVCHEAADLCLEPPWQCTKFRWGVPEGIHQLRQTKIILHHPICHRINLDNSRLTILQGLPLLFSAEVDSDLLPEVAKRPSASEDSAPWSHLRVGGHPEKLEKKHEKTWYHRPTTNAPSVRLYPENHRPSLVVSWVSDGFSSSRSINWASNIEPVPYTAWKIWESARGTLYPLWHRGIHCDLWQLSHVARLRNATFNTGCLEMPNWDWLQASSQLSQLISNRECIPKREQGIAADSHIKTNGSVQFNFVGYGITGRV